MPYETARKGWEKYPDKFESEQIDHRCREAGMLASAISTDAFDAYIRGEYDLNTMELWLDEQKTRRPHLFPDVGQCALEARAFMETGVLDLKARGELVNLIGQANAEARAKEWGLRDLKDFRTQGRRPCGADLMLHEQQAKLEKEIAERQRALAAIRSTLPPEPGASSNPFTRLLRPDGTRDESVAAHIVGMIRAMGTKKVEEIAAAVGRRLDGSPIPAKFG